MTTNVADALMACNEPFFFPIDKAENLRTETLRRDGTWTQALTARVLFLAQIIVSVVAIVFNLLAAIIAPVGALCAGERTLVSLTGAGAMVFAHLLVIPTALIAACLPHSLEWDAPASIFSSN